MAKHFSATPATQALQSKVLVETLPPGQDEAMDRPLDPVTPAVPSLHERAASDLRFLRSMVEDSGRFTAVSGRAVVLMGCVALAASAVSFTLTAPRDRVHVWLVAALVSITLGALDMRRKAIRNDAPVLGHLGRRCLLGLTPPLFAGAVLTFVHYRSGELESLPSIWLLLYGAGVITGGAQSVRAVLVTGLGLLVLGTVAALAPPSWDLPLLALGFGVLHVAAGLWITRHHGG